ncbi:MAG: toll/interleukin-1 receptor domain-containing protein [Candidatus Solibacter sp.]
MLTGAVVALSAAAPFVRIQRVRTVFLSYRRSDTGGEIRAIADRVASHFGRQRVFYDVRSIGAGEDFREAIGRTLRQCDAAVIVIGPDWATCRDDAGQLRLHSAEDVVRGEVSAALDSGALVIPLLVRLDQPPKESELPPDLRGLFDRNAVWYDAQLASTVASIASAPVRRTPVMLLMSHLAVAIFPFVFYAGTGLAAEEFTITLAIVTPMLAATAAVALVHRLRNVNPTRILQVRPAELFVPLIFVALIGALVLLKAFNIWIESFHTFFLLLLATECAFAAYTGVALASVFENRRKP